MRRVRPVCPVAVAVAAAGAIAGCSGSSNEGSPPPTISSTPSHHHHHPTATPSPSVTVTVTTSSPPPASLSPTTPQAVTACATSQLSLSLGQSQGAAGTTYTPIVLTNQGSVSCRLTGYPGVSFLDASGAQVGPSAARTSGHVRTVTLSAHGSASAMLQQSEPGNYPRSSCKPKQAKALEVYPPDQTAALTATDHVEVCSTSTGRTGISPMQPGTDPQP
jgi:hypothetical protein